MRAFVIGQPGERDATMRSALDHGVQPNAIRPIPVEDAERELAATGLRWTWPLHGVATISSLTCHAYKTKDHRARVSCFLAHLNAWQFCAQSGEPCLVMESDCEWMRDWDPAYPVGAFGMTSLNDPRGATRCAKRYHWELQHARSPGEDDHSPEVVGVPWVDDDATIPQGLPGHSAYIIQSWFAAELIAGAKRYGAMPNDALANKVWFPGKLGCVTNYFTRVSGRKSTLA